MGSVPPSFWNFMRCILTLFVISILLDGMDIHVYFSTAAGNILLAVSFFIGLCISQHHFNKEDPCPRTKKDHKVLKFLFSSAAAANKSMDRRQKAMEDALMRGLMGSPSSSRAAEERLRQARKKADMDARARYDALDNAKKAEYDARDAALRGKDRAAYQYQNQADYWYEQSKR